MGPSRSKVCSSTMPGKIYKEKKKTKNMHLYGSKIPHTCIFPLCLKRTTIFSIIPSYKAHQLSYCQLNKHIRSSGAIFLRLRKFKDKLISDRYFNWVPLGSKSTTGVSHDFLHWFTIRLLEHILIYLYIAFAKFKTEFYQVNLAKFSHTH